MSATATRERPILFSGPMVRAILEGRKTQTRRVLDLSRFRFAAGASSRDFSAVGGWQLLEDGDFGAYLAKFNVVIGQARCPFGVPGDLVWVRETWGPMDGGLCYRADIEPGARWKPDDGRWHPAIHMYRKFSRLSLRITAVRVERLQEIQEADAVAEGMTITVRENGALDAFRQGWDSINGKRASWASNPWVWVVSFERIGGAT